MPPKKKKENPVKQKDHRHHRPLCNWADRLYEEACDYVEINRGTDYPCEERHLKELAGNLRTHNGRFATLRHGTESLLRHLDKSREPSRREYEALDLLGGFLSQGGYGADIAIKAFVDLDHVFFRGKLHGFVTVQWVNEKEIKAIQGVDALGATSNIDEGRAWIKMSKGVFARTYDGDGVATCMWGTLLHEMLHAYFIVVVGNSNETNKDDVRRGWPLYHGPRFCECLKAIHYRATELLDLKVMPDWDPLWKF